MTDDDTSPVEASPSRTPSASRRRFLAGVAAVAGTAVAPTAAAATARQAPTEVVATFEPPNLPENIATDPQGDVYVSMAPSHEVWRVSPDGEASSVATVGPADEGGFLLGLTRADDGTMHAVLNSGSEDTHGVWRLPPDGSPELMAAIPVEGTFPNGVTDELLDDALVVSDSRRGVLWRVDDGGADVWLDSPLLDPDPYADSPIGVNGVDVGPDGDLYVANLDFGAVVRFPVDDGEPGDPSVLARSDGLVGADGIEVDDDGAVYVAVNALDKVSRVDPDGSVATVATGDEFAFPADVQFGPGGDRSTLYVANFSLTSFQAEGETAEPTLVRIDLGGG